MTVIIKTVNVSTAEISKQNKTNSSNPIARHNINNNFSKNILSAVSALNTLEMMETKQKQ